MTPDFQAQIPDIILAPFPHDPHPTQTVTSALEINPLSSPLCLHSSVIYTTPHITFRCEGYEVPELLNTYCLVNKLHCFSATVYKQIVSQKQTNMQKTFKTNKIQSHFPRSPFFFASGQKSAVHLTLSPGFTTNPIRPGISRY